jgi:hypothetical protein
MTTLSAFFSYFSIVSSKLRQRFCLLILLRGRTLVKAIYLHWLFAIPVDFKHNNNQWPSNESYHRYFCYCSGLRRQLLTSRILPQLSGDAYRSCNRQQHTIAMWANLARPNYIPCVSSSKNHRRKTVFLFDHNYVANKIILCYSTAPDTHKEVFLPIGPPKKTILWYRSSP